MSKLKLLAQVLNGELKDSSLTDEQRKARIEETLKGFAVDMLNIHAFFISKNVDDNTLKEIMQQNDLDYNLKTKKYF